MNHPAPRRALPPAGPGPSRSNADDLRETILASRILVVDDQQIIRELLRAYLTAGGYSNLVFAEDGAEALEAIRSDRPDLVILDLRMPRVDGLEVCAAVRADREHARLPVLVQTAADSAEDRAKVFAAGATDMVGKPINQAELLARVGIHLQNRHMLHQLSVYRESMERQLETARRMQHDLLPGDDLLDRLKAHYRLDIQAHFQTCDTLGGDLWNVWPVDDRRMGFAVVDFAGHGVTASLNTFRFQSLALARNLPEVGLRAYAEGLNRQLNRLLSAGQFATAIAGYVDIGADLVHYVAAGGPRPFLVAPGAADGRFCASAGRPLGIAQDSEYPEFELPFPPESSLFLYSDALVETPSMVDPVYDEDRIRAVLTGQADCAPMATPFDTLVTDFFRRGQGTLTDDLTLLMLTRAERGCG